MAMPFIYAFLVRISVETLTDEFITYLIMLTAMVSLYSGAQGMKQFDK